MEVPRPIPNYDRKSLASDWWYCLYCRQPFPSEYSAKTHVRQHHYGGDSEAEAVKGEDYTNGTHLRILMDRWDAWSLTAVDRFHLQLESLRGADDFAQEVGDGVPE